MLLFIDTGISTLNTYYVPRVDTFDIKEDFPHIGFFNIMSVVPYVVDEFLGVMQQTIVF